MRNTPVTSRAEQGYTLIELSIVITVLGLMLGSFFTAYNVYLQSQSRLNTHANITESASALTNFLAQNGRYPCPSRIDAVRTDADYGIETQCDDTQADYPSPSTSGTCNAGLCFETSVAVLDHDQNVLTAPITPKVRRGGVPFRSLGLPEEKALDGYGARLNYALTEILAVTATNKKENGGILVLNNSGNSFFRKEVTPGVHADAYTHYFLFSSGVDQAGAYNRWGQLIAPCVATARDGENCNTTASATATYRMSEIKNAAGAEHFDDFVKFYMATETPLWRVSGNGAHIRDLLDAENTPTVSKVGIGTVADPSNAAMLQVAGTVAARGGGPVQANVYTADICAADQSKCVQAEKVINEVDFMCPQSGDPASYKYVKGISNGKVECTDAINPGCAPGTFVKNIKPDGSFECRSNLACVPKTINLCGSDTYTLTTGTQDEERETTQSGLSYRQKWKCGPSDQWNYLSDSGSCTCADVDETYDVPCNSRRAGNWTGLVTLRHTHVCATGVDTVTEVPPDSCACVNTTETYIDYGGCGTGFTGSIMYQRDWNCTTGTTGNWTSWYIPPGGNTCVCDPITQTQSLSCPVAHVGTWTQTRDHVCPANTWTPWTDSTYTCACVNGYTETRGVACPPGWSGGKTEKRTYDCPTSSWSGWGPNTDTCSCTNTSEDDDVGCPFGHTGTKINRRDFTCPGASWGGWYNVTNTCTCTGAPDDERWIPCTAPLSGQVQQKRVYSCLPTPGYGPWVNTGTDTCVAVSYTWVPKTSATGPNPSPLSKRAYDSCAAPGTVSSCSAAAGSGLGHWYYDTCECE